MFAGRRRNVPESPKAANEKRYSAESLGNISWRLLDRLVGNLNMIQGKANFKISSTKSGCGRSAPETPEKMLKSSPRQHGKGQAFEIR